MIRLDDVTFTYGKTPLIQDISLAFAPGEITTIVGPNGCGKSTLLKLCTKLLTPKSGRVLLGDVDIARMRRRDYAKRVSVLLQSNPPTPMTAGQVVLSGRYPYHHFVAAGRADEEVVIRAMEMTFCRQLWHKEVARLSGGERQRVYLAMVLAQDTDLVFLDEPTTRLDINVSFEIMELVKRLNQELGKTVVMVLHDLNLALQYSHNIVVMEQGRVIACDTADSLADGAVLSRVFHMQIKGFDCDGKRCFCFRQMAQ